MEKAMLQFLHLMWVSILIHASHYSYHLSSQMHMPTQNTVTVFGWVVQCWNKIFVGYVLTLPGNHVYFKNLNVKVVLDFDKYYINRQPQTIPHIHNNLKGKPSPGVSYEYPIEVETTGVLPLWLRWYYAVDINAGSISMENARKSGHSVKEAFTHVFGDVPYRSQTQAGPTARAAFIEAAYPAKGAAEKAAKKCLAHAL
ncbi:uncharacterized protein F5891DRAFT_981805 [Suillus fuscotomentosus]|uniref:Uncharacterized protein n=1 Tax=Suillus fuscotomentosus TaxID=1912939 RepID=A0AAD4HJA2_9AGAM|nr:uncharacterized protein F5891DRAFT_981805 [Suillus fuscotomentosus]KAG1898663.1 hypothetical protein F5891DRAFT_981805 [Suillus fuscotomentosus]